MLQACGLGASPFGLLSRELATFQGPGPESGPDLRCTSLKLLHWSCKRTGSAEHQSQNFDAWSRSSIRCECNHPGWRDTPFPETLNLKPRLTLRRQSGPPLHPQESTRHTNGFTQAMRITTAHHRLDASQDPHITPCAPPRVERTFPSEVKWNREKPSVKLASNREKSSESNRENPRWDAAWGWPTVGRSQHT